MEVQVPLLAISADQYNVGVGCIWDLLLSDVCGRLLLMGGADAAYIGILPFQYPPFFCSLDITKQ